MFFYIFIVCKETERDTIFVEVTIREICYVLIFLPGVEQLFVAIETFKPDGFLLEEHVEMEHGVPLADYLVSQKGFDCIPIGDFGEIQRALESRVSFDKDKGKYLQFPDGEMLFKIVDALFFCLHRYSMPVFSVFSFQ